MWWLIIIPFVIVIALIIFLVALIIAITNAHNNGDYGDGGGAQVGGEDNIPFFMPANDRAKSGVRCIAQFIYKVY